MEAVERTLRVLLEFQRFAENKRLQGLIRAAGAGLRPGGAALEDDELEVFAAGDGKPRRRGDEP